MKSMVSTMFKIISKNEFGKKGETIAVEYLKKHGYSILKRNFRFSRLGEIDIIAREKEYLCFIEVKTRKSTQFGMPSESVNTKKQEKIKKLSQIYLSNNNLNNQNMRFDIIEVLFLKNNNIPKINVIKNAF